MAPPSPPMNRLSNVQLFTVKLTNIGSRSVEPSSEAIFKAPPLIVAEFTFVKRMFLNDTEPFLILKILADWPFPSMTTFPYPINAK